MSAIVVLFLSMRTIAQPAPPRIGGDFALAIESALPRVVKLYGLGVGLEAGYGTGVVVSEDGRVLTVLSLLIDARRMRAVSADGTAYEAEVVHRDPSRQLALLQLMPAEDELHGSGFADAPEEHTAVGPGGRVGPFSYFDLHCAADSGQAGNQTLLQPGDWVVSAGNAFKVADGAEPMSIAHGVFSARTRLDARRRARDFSYTGDVLVIDAITSNPGAPGSALVNLDGVLVGMIGREVVSNLTHTHLNYAVPLDVLCGFLEEAGDDPVAMRDDRLAAPDEPPKGFDAGIRISTTGYQTVLPFVERVRRGSPAARAGVRKDDLILSVNGKNVSSGDEYEKRARLIEPGTPMDVVIRRGRRIVTLRIEPEAQP